MPKISVTANWDGLPPLDATDIISRIPSFINIETSTDPKTMLIEEKMLGSLAKAVKNYGLEINITNWRQALDK